MGWNSGVAAAMLALVALAPGTMADERVWTPGASSRERAAVLEAAREPLQKDLAQDVDWVVRHVRVSADWALVAGTPRRKDGRAIDYSLSIYKDQAASKDFTGQAAVLLARDGKAGPWRVVTYSVGFGQQIWESWDEEFGAPAWLWP